MQDARDTTDNPSRRRLIAGSSAALLAGSAIATSSHGETKLPAATGELVPAQHDLAEKIADLRATTLDGLRAKATVLLAYTGYRMDGASPLWDNHDELMGWSIARDLLGAEAAKADYLL